MSVGTSKEAVLEENREASMRVGHTCDPSWREAEAGSYAKVSWSDLRELISKLCGGPILRSTIYRRLRLCWAWRAFLTASR